MTIRAVIFDRDNTLMYFDGANVTTFGAQIKAVAPQLSLDTVIRQWMTWPGPWPHTVEAEPSFWEHFWTVAGQHQPLYASQIARLCEVGAQYHTCFAVFADASACLHTLRERGLRLALLTNFELPSIDRTLIHAGIDPALFDVMLCSSILKVSKPDPDAFRAVAAALGEPLEHCAVVDDLPEHVSAARALGMRAIRIDRKSAHHDLANDMICSLEPLPHLLCPPFTVAGR